MNDFLVEGRWQTAPPLLPAADRPPTKQEVWAYVSHVYEGVKTPDEMKAYARDKWLEYYRFFVNIKGWRKQPDWTDGQPVIAEACPSGPFFYDQPWATEVERLWRLARERLATSAQMTLEAA